MKYRDPRTGEVYHDITSAWEAFCAGLEDACPACPLTASKTGRNFTCNDFVVKCETEAARRMGLEVVEESFAERLEASVRREEPMEKKDKPRICDVLGVEVGEPFKIKGYNGEYHINDEGVLKWGRRTSDDAIYEAINHPDRIIRKPRFTEEEVEDAKNIMRFFQTAYSIERYKDSTLGVRSREQFLMNITNSLFPSLRPGQAVRVEDIIV